MSFLENLNSARKSLRSTETIITTVDGKRFLKKSITSSDHDLIPLAHTTIGFVIDTKPDQIPACILKDFLYLGSQDACNEEILCKYRITYILSIGVRMPLNISLKNMRNLYVPCLDLMETNLNAGILDISFQFIEECRKLNECILIHCNAGVSRSATIVIAYLMKYLGMSYIAAYDHVKLRRPCIQPNDGFQRQLKLLE